MINKMHIAILIPLLFLGGCVKKKIRVHSSCFADTESIPSGFTSGKSFSIKTAKKENCILSKELEKKAKRILTDNGFEIKLAEDADYSIFIDYGMATERGMTQVLEYVPEEIVLGTSEISGDHGYTSCKQEYKIPSKYVWVPHECCYYNKFLSLNVYDSKLSRQSPNDEYLSKIWYGIATNNDEDPDILTYLDFLLIDLMRWFGHNIQKTSLYSIKL